MDKPIEKVGEYRYVDDPYDRDELLRLKINEIIDALNDLIIENDYKGKVLTWGIKGDEEPKPCTDVSGGER